MPFYLILMLFISCSTAPTLKVDRSKWKVSEMTMPEGEAAALIAQKHNFITMTYQNYFDPLFQSMKWTEECRQQNNPGDVRNDDSLILLHSIIFTGPDFQPGFCPDHEGARKTSFVMLYCKKTKKLMQVSCTQEDCGQIFWDKQC